MVSGFVASVNGKKVADRFVNVVVAIKVQHSQSMRDPLVNIWIIKEKDGPIARILDINVLIN